MNILAKNKINENDNSKSKDNIKTTGQVIIRREVIVDDEPKETTTKKTNRSDIGFTEKKNRTFNIVYREKTKKPMTVSELFGIKEETKKSNKAENKENIEKETKSDVKNEKDLKSENNEKTIKPENSETKFESSEEAKRTEHSETVEKSVKSVENEVVQKNVETKSAVEQKAEKVENTKEAENNLKTDSSSEKVNNYRKNQEFSSRNANKRDSGFNNFQKTSNFVNKNRNNGFRRDDNRNTDFRNNNFRNNNFKNSDAKNNTDFRNKRNDNKNGFNRNSNQNNFRRITGGISSFKNDNYKETIPTDYAEKEGQRNYSARIIGKQKANRNLDENKKNRSRRYEEEEVSEDKLRNLKQVDKLSNMFEDQEGGMLDYYDLTTARGKRNKKKTSKDNKSKQKIFELKEITIPEVISVKDLATELKKTSTEIIKKLLELGIMANINQNLDFDTAYLVADSFGVTAKKKETVSDEELLFDDSEDKEEDLKPRPPVVVVMGHVDHGKTSLLDAIRKTNVIEGEAGGITQHIGAYKVKVNGREITFLDTPGHEAFTSMRARGAQITDIAILVVAADDGVMPQTVEAIHHAKAANIPIIVAVNKIDLPGANVEKVKQELMKYDLVPEEWGGDTIFVPISAKKNINIDNLLEMVLLEADMLNLRANPNKQSKGTVMEARLDKTQGPVASVLVQRGTLNVGDTIILGTSIGKIRTMKDDKGKNVKAAGPSTPVEITGLSSVPEGGDVFYEVENEKVAKHLIEKRKLEEREKAIANANPVTLDNLFEKMAKEDLKQFNIIVKTDVKGTAEALKDSLEKLSNDEIIVKVLHSDAGGVTESDVELAAASKAIIIAFNSRPVGGAKNLAEKMGVEIKQYSVIYQALDDVENAMKGMLAPKYQEVTIGNAEVRQTFKISKVGTIAGCYVTDGKLERNAGVRVIRNGVVVFDGKLISLKRFKDDAKEVDAGFECGIQIDGFNDIQTGDTIEAYVQEEVKR